MSKQAIALLQAERDALMECSIDFGGRMSDEDSSTVAEYDDAIAEVQKLVSERDELASRVRELETEVLDQCRLNGMGAERELALMSRVRELEGAALAAQPGAVAAAIPLTAYEMQCNHSRVNWAEGLIRQLPENHDGRNSWLLNYGNAPRPKDYAALAAQHGAVAAKNNDVDRLLRQVFLLCEAVEDLPEIDPKNEHERGFDRGRRFQAKQIRRAIGDWFQWTFCGSSFMGEPVLAAAPTEAKPAQQDAVDAEQVDEIVTSLYRRFKEWSKRGFGPEDVTWCEVKAEVQSLCSKSKGGEQFNAAIDFAITQGIEAAAFLDAWRHGDISEWPEFAAISAKKGQP